MKKIKFYVALRGDKTPQEYIQIAKTIEELGFDRIYVYDDLMFHSSTPILTLIAEHTNRIEVGPCLVNGFYRHPAIIAEEMVFLNQIAPGRIVIGLGRGAFFDFYNMPDSEEHTRKGVLEAILHINRLLAGDKDELHGDLFHASSKAFLRIPLPQCKIPIVVGSWNQKVAGICGQYGDELQAAEAWNAEFLNELKASLDQFPDKNNGTRKIFSIGGMSCISDDIEKAFEIAKQTCAVYIPYLSQIINKYGYNTDDEAFQELFRYSRNGEYKKCAELIKNEWVNKLSLVGSPEDIVKKINDLKEDVDFASIMMSPPYGTLSIEDNLKLIMERVVKKVNCL